MPPEPVLSLAFAIVAGLVLGGSVAAVSCRNRVHAGLFLAVALVGLALVFLRMGAEFLGFIQILVYVGAVAVLIVFAILLTRGSDSAHERRSNAPGIGIGLAVLLWGVLAWGILHRSPGAIATPSPPPSMAVRDLGERLLREELLPLQTVGLLLTAALIGAALIALPEPGISPRPSGSHGSAGTETPPSSPT
ncbi:MAG: NADH-quinone oxidoreductase subunit J [Verrucomicrobiales bacterium]|nr:NADH-quinone oxidoreductase subunit J [Verrucomicrobiales bacterium]